MCGGVIVFAVSARVLQSLWELLLRMILDTITENRGVQVEFYNRFQYTVEVSAQRLDSLADSISLCPFSSSFTVHCTTRNKNQPETGTGARSGFSCLCFNQLQGERTSVVLLP